MPTAKRFRRKVSWGRMLRESEDEAKGKILEPWKGLSPATRRGYEKIAKLFVERISDDSLAIAARKLGY